MSITLLLYLVELLHNVDEFSGWVFLIFGLSLGLLSFGWMFSKDMCSTETNGIISGLIKKLWKNSWVLVVAIVISIFVPSQKTMYLMLGTSYLSSTKLPTKVEQALELKLDSVIDELRHDKINKKQQEPNNE